MAVQNRYMAVEQGYMAKKEIEKELKDIVQ